jgi:hypothetical protein
MEWTRNDLWAVDLVELYNDWREDQLEGEAEDLACLLEARLWKSLFYDRGLGVTFDDFHELYTYMALRDEELYELGEVPAASVRAARRRCEAFGKLESFGLCPHAQDSAGFDAESDGGSEPLQGFDEGELGARIRRAREERAAGTYHFEERVTPLPQVRADTDHTDAEPAGGSQLEGEAGVCMALRRLCQGLVGPWRFC